MENFKELSMPNNQRHRVRARFERTYSNCTNCKANFLVNYLLPKLQWLRAHAGPAHAGPAGAANEQLKLYF